MRLAANLFAAVLALAPGSRAAAVPPANIRISLQLIEVAHPTLTELLAGRAISGDKLHNQAMALVHGGRAKVLETCILTCKDGRMARAESIREVTYPTEYEPGGLGSSPQVLPMSTPPLIRPDLFQGWQTRNAGVTFEVEAALTHDRKIVLVRLVPEIVDPVGLVTWVEYRDAWGDCSTRMPTFDTLRTNSMLSLAAGSFELAAVLTPRPSRPTPANSRKVLVFVRADLP